VHAEPRDGDLLINALCDFCTNEPSIFAVHARGI